MMKMKFFTITQFNQEEKWLAEMASQGWFLKSSRFPCFYFFEKGKPEKMVYRFDFFDSAEARQDCENLFEEYGWKSIESMNGFLLFAKPAAHTSPEDLEIFSTEQSRQEMLERIAKGRLIPVSICLAIVIACFLFTLGHALTAPADENHWDSVIISGICC